MQGVPKNLAFCLKNSTFTEGKIPTGIVGSDAPFGKNFSSKMYYNSSRLAVGTKGFEQDMKNKKRKKTLQSL